MHSVQMAKRVYTVSSAKNDAKLAKLLYELILGPHVEWPSSRDTHGLELSVIELGGDISEELTDFTADVDDDLEQQYANMLTD